MNRSRAVNGARVARGALRGALRVQILIDIIKNNVSARTPRGA
jgi:hypothetical protein